MYLLIIGPPGAGKGTQAEMLCKKYNISQLATGDILRKNVNEETYLGKLAKSYMSAGKLVPDELMITMIKEEILDPKYSNGFILDGFPRNLSQADALCDLLNERDIFLEKVFVLIVPNEIIIERLSGRRICRSCNRTYHVKYNPPPNNGECDCGKSDIFQRDDDKVDTVVHRLDVYDKQTSPLIEYYRKKNKVVEIDGTQDLKKVFEIITDSLK